MVLGRALVNIHHKLCGNGASVYFLSSNDFVMCGVPKLRHCPSTLARDLSKTRRLKLPYSAKWSCQISSRYLWWVEQRFEKCIY